MSCTIRARSPIQAASDFDPAEGRASRRELVTRFADSGTLVLGSHFAEPVAGHIRREGDEFRFVHVAQPHGV